MQKATTVDGCVIAFRHDIKSLLRARVREAIEMVLEEELDEALGCGRYERGGTRFGYRHGTVERRVTKPNGPETLEVCRAAGWSAKAARAGSSAARSVRATPGAVSGSTRPSWAHTLRAPTVGGSAFTPQGLPASVDPPGFGLTDVTDFSYDDATRGNVIVTARTDPITGTTTFGYDAFNRRTSVTDPNGVTTNTEYDMLDRVTRVIQRGPDDMTEADDLITEHRYNVFGDLFQTVLPEGNVIEYGYDHVGRLTSIERKANDLPSTHGERTVFTLDSFGHRIREEQQRWDASTSLWVSSSATVQTYSTRCFLDKTTEGAGSANESVTELATIVREIWSRSGMPTIPPRARPCHPRR